MKEITGDLFSEKCDAICITTNGMIRKDGRAVMGAGVARVARDRYPDIDLILALKLKQNGNVTQILIPNQVPAILSLPTKNDWRDKSDIGLIEASCKRLVQICNERGWTKVCLTRPGCGNGGLDWEKEVRPVISAILDDRFHIITPK